MLLITDISKLFELWLSSLCRIHLRAFSSYGSLPTREWRLRKLLLVVPQLWVDLLPSSPGTSRASVSSSIKQGARCPSRLIATEVVTVSESTLQIAGCNITQGNISGKRLALASILSLATWVYNCTVFPVTSQMLINPVCITETYCQNYPEAWWSDAIDTRPMRSYYCHHGSVVMVTIAGWQESSLTVELERRRKLNPLPALNELQVRVKEKKENC